MSTGLYTHTTRATGTVLTASIYNADHVNHVTNQNPSQTGSYSDNVAQMQSNTNPGGVGSESLAASLAGELERLRFQVKAIIGGAQWYSAAPTSLTSLVGAGVADNSITNAKLADMAAWTFKVRNAGSSGDPSDAADTDVTSGTAVGADFVVGFKSTHEIRKFPVSDFTLSAGGGTTFNIEPQGRLTLTASVPVLVNTVSGATTIRYTPYKGRFVPLWNGSVFVITDMGGELTQATTDNTKSPAAVANNSNYDMFVWSDSGTIRCTRGPPWTSNTARGAGAGTTELVRVNGVPLNNVAITNGPAAQRGTYVGTVRSNGSSAIDWIYGTVASGGGLATLGVYNAYGRVNVSTFVGDSTDSWTLDTVTWRSANASNNMRVNFIQGLQEESIYSDYTTRILVGFVTSGTVTTQSKPAISVCLDGTSTPMGRYSGGGVGGSSVPGTQQHTASYLDTLLGFHFVQAIEQSALNTTVTHTTMYGDNTAGTPIQNGIRLSGRF